MSKGPRKPKDADNWDFADEAFQQLERAAQHWRRVYKTMPTRRVKWEVSLRFWDDEWLKPRPKAESR